MIAGRGHHKGATRKRKGCVGDDHGSQEATHGLDIVDGPHPGWATEDTRAPALLRQLGKESHPVPDLVVERRHVLHPVNARTLTIAQLLEHPDDTLDYRRSRLCRRPCAIAPPQPPATRSKHSAKSRSGARSLGKAASTVSCVGRNLSSAAPSLEVGDINVAGPMCTRRERCLTTAFRVSDGEPLVHDIHKHRIPNVSEILEKRLQELVCAIDIPELPGREQQDSQ